MAKDKDNVPDSSSTHRDEEAASHHDDGHHQANNNNPPDNNQRDGCCKSCCSSCSSWLCCCQLRILPYGLLRWALATTSSVIALAITVLAAGTCHFIKYQGNNSNAPSSLLPSAGKIGINRYEDTDGSCEMYHNGNAKDIVYQSVYWDVVRYFVDIGVIIMFFLTLFLATTGLFEYKCAGRTFFAKLAVGMAAMNTLNMASFLVFASDICASPWSKCFLSDGTFLMMGAIVAWWIAGWFVLNMIPLGQPHDGYESLHLPSRWRDLYVEVCGATIVAAAAVNGAIIATERRNN